MQSASLYATVSNTSLPPTYSGVSNPAPPAYLDASPSNDMVSPSQIAAHLRLLAAYAKLQQDVEAMTVPCCHEMRPYEACEVPDCSGLLTSECKRALFVQMAVWRFEVWLKTIVAQGNYSLPPLDVLFIWSTYLGNPTQ
jgi:hypothetical protein